MNIKFCKFLSWLSENSQFALFTILIIFFTISGSNLFAVQTGFPFGLGSVYQDCGTDIAVDKDNNIYIAGYFQGTVDFDPSREGKFELTASGDPANENSIDIFIAKFDKDSEFLKAYSISSNGMDVLHKIRIDKDENIYITGFIGGRADFDFAPETEHWLEADSGKDGFIAKYDRNMKLLWAYKFGDSDEIASPEQEPGYDICYDINFDGSGNVVVVGNFSGKIDLNPTNDTIEGDTVSSAPGYDNLPTQDLFVVSFSSDGKYKWGMALGGKGFQSATAVVFDLNNDFYIAGYFSDSFDIDPNPEKKVMLSSRGLYDSYLAKFDVSGKHIWSFSWGSTGWDYVNSGCLAIDEGNNVYVAGIYSGNTDFNPNGFDQLNSQGSTDAFFAKYDKNKNYIFARSIGGERSDQLKALILKDSSIYIAGSYGGVVDFDPFSGDNLYLMTSKGTQSAYDGFLAKYTLNGNVVYAAGFGTESSSGDNLNISTGLAIDSLGFVIVTGNYFNKILFYPNDFALFSKGKSDVLVAKYRVDGSLITTNTSVEISESGIITEVFPNPANRFVVFRSKDIFPDKIAVYNAFGELVKEFSSIDFAGGGEIVWDLTDNGGNLIPSGVYFIIANSGNDKLTGKLSVFR